MVLQGFAKINSFVAMGDSITEGMCDPVKTGNGDVVGWADRLAMILAYAEPDRPEPFRYANLAIRSKKVGDIIQEQLPKTLELKPDLVSLLAGANDLANFRTDPDKLSEKLEDLVKTLVENGSHVLLSTNFDPMFGFLKKLRGRAAIYNANMWSIAEKYGATVLDFWGFEEFQDRFNWADDRVHLSSSGHRALAYRAAEALGVQDASALGRLEAVIHEDLFEPQSISGNLMWAWRYVRPWLFRRITRRAAGDGRSAKHEDYVFVDQKTVETRFSSVPVLNSKTSRFKFSKSVAK